MPQKGRFLFLMIGQKEKSIGAEFIEAAVDSPGYAHGRFRGRG